ncbi:DNA repair protein RecN [Thermodesulfobacteriota bacterium]
MLVKLSISDFAIIRHLDMTIRSGLNIISGETGAGKSIIINAVNLILGARASTDLIRSGCSEARVEALFILPENIELKETLSGLGFSFDGELLIKRTISREGRNTITVNGSLATLQMLSMLASRLISISGQHEHQLLSGQDNHIIILDDFGGLSGERESLYKLNLTRQRLKEKISSLEEEIKIISERQELNRFQIQEIEGAQLKPGEDETLVDERRRLEHSEELMEIVSEGYTSLYEDNNSSLSVLSRVLKRIEKGVAFDEGLTGVRDALSDCAVKIEDISFSLRDLQKTIELDPNKLEEMVQRIELLNELKRKYGPTLEDVLRYRENLTTIMGDLEGKRSLLNDFEVEKKSLESDLLELAKALSEKRKRVARSLESAVEEELTFLHMGQTKFRVAFNGSSDIEDKSTGFSIEEIRDDGFDRVEFVISPNVGEELRPLSRIASGGELSRIMLALKTILARTGSVETIIFDEIDSGISGATAEVVGKKLFSLSGYHQILCITHLPQIASQGRTHFLVRKDVDQGRTMTEISELNEESRVREIARLLGGQEITVKALDHAKEMLD